MKRISRSNAATGARSIIRPLKGRALADAFDRRLKRGVWLIAGALMLPMAAQAQIVDLGTLGGGTSSGEGVSGDGTIAVGHSTTSGGNTHAFRWGNGVMTDLGVFAGGDDSQALGISGDGQVIVGWSSGAGFQRHAIRWSGGAMTDLGTLGGLYSYARDASTDGSVIVGASHIMGNTYRAFRWEGGVMTDLGILNGGTHSYAMGVSGDGSVVAGYYNILVPNEGEYTRAFRWEGGTMVELATLGGNEAAAYGVSRDGAVIVGYSRTNGNIPRHAALWSGGNVTDLGTLGGLHSAAYGASADGSVVVGSSIISSTEARGFRWTQASGMQSVEDWLRSTGVTVPADITADAIQSSDDGSVVVGTLTSSDHAYLARAGSGLINIQNYSNSLAGLASASPSLAARDAELVMHGAHGSPMRGLLRAGRTSLWTAGDWGRADHQNMDADLGVGELGLAHGLTEDVMIKVAVGRTYSRQDSGEGGHARVTGTYVLPELIAAIPGTGFRGTISGYYNRGDADVVRGYFNAGLVDHSSGDASVEVAGLRLRGDWLDAVKLGAANITPYVSATHFHTRVDSYTESGGGFPVHWGARSENITQYRLGADAIRPINERVNLLGRLEAVHQVQGQGAGVDVDVLGLFSTRLAGEHYKRDWLRAAIGLEASGLPGNSTASLMLNATTQGNVASYWLAANWRMDF